MSPGRWTRDPKVRWVGLNDVLTAFLMCIDAWLVYSASVGSFDSTTRTVIIGANLAGAGVAFYWAYGKQAAEGGPGVVGVNGSEEEGGAGGSGAGPSETGGGGPHRGGQPQGDGAETGGQE